MQDVHTILVCFDKTVKKQGYIYSKITTQLVFVHHQRYFHALTGINLFRLLDPFQFVGATQ